MHTGVREYIVCGVVGDCQSTHLERLTEVAQCERGALQLQQTLRLCEHALRSGGRRRVVGCVLHGAAWILKRRHGRPVGSQWLQRCPGSAPSRYFLSGSTVTRDEITKGTTASSKVVIAGDRDNES